MKIKLYAGLPGAASFNPLLPEDPAGTSGGTNGGAGATPPAPAPPTPTPPAAGAPAAVGPNGYPEGTPLAEMTIEQRLAYQTHWNRQNRTALEAAQAKLAELEPIGEQFRALAEASKSEQERAIEVARTEAAAAARTEGESAAAARYVGPLVQARFESVLAGSKTPAEVTTIVGGLNVAAFLGSDGLPDTEKVAAYAATIAPAPATPAPINLGGGRTTPVTPSGTQAGADLYAQRNKRATTA